MTKREAKIVHYYVRYAAGASGVTEALTCWAELAERLGYVVEIWSAGGDGVKHRLLHRVAHLGRGRRLALPVGLLWSLRGVDLLYLHEGWALSNVVAVMIGRLRRTKVVLMPHGVYDPHVVAIQRDAFGVRRALERWVLRSVDAIHVFYDSEYDDIRLLEPRAARPLSAPNGGPEPESVQAWTGSGDYVCWIGRFDPYHKGIDLLLEAWAQLPQPPPQLVLAGPDFMGGRGEVERLVERLSLTDHVKVIGPVYGDDKTALLAGCVAYVHPSRWESCSIALLENLAMGVPSLVSDSIHAAPVLKAAGVAQLCDFTSGRALGPAMTMAVGNHELSRASRLWMSEQGSWNAVERRYRPHLEVLLREQSVADPALEP
jgi:glycosyltransferase involved in cell wall biosynthesis